MGAFDLAVQPRGAGLDVGVGDALVEHVPVEGGLELGSLVGLDDFDLERQARAASPTLRCSPWFPARSDTAGARRPSPSCPRPAARRRRTGTGHDGTRETYLVITDFRVRQAQAADAPDLARLRWAFKREDGEGGPSTNPGQFHEPRRAVDPEAD
jgi:hypothetical protein